MYAFVLLHQVHLPKSLAFSGIPPMFSVSMHLVELILQDEAPLCYSAFKLSGFTPSQVVIIIVKCICKAIIICIRIFNYVTFVLLGTRLVSLANGSVNRCVTTLDLSALAPAMLLELHGLA